MIHSPPTSPSGLLLIDKPGGRGGPTSMDVCRHVKRRLINAGYPKKIKVGHGGTLDPLASGLLVVLVGRATKLCDAIMAGEKRYLADIDLAHTSSTDDHEGELTPTPIAAPPTREEIERALPAFTGTIQQRPPAFSAMKIGGQRAYKLARRGQLGGPDGAQLQPRPVTIHSIDLIEYAFPLLRLDIRCGKGTYIRSLARDLGAALGTGGCLAALRRTASGPFTVENAVPLHDLPDTLHQPDFLPAP